MKDPDQLGMSWPLNKQARLRNSLAEISSAEITTGCLDISMVMRELTNENQSSSNSSKAGDCCSISSSPVAGCSPRPHEDHSQDGDKVSSIVNNSHTNRETQVGGIDDYTCVYE